MEGGRNLLVLFIFLLCISMEAFHIHWTEPFIGKMLCDPVAALRA